MTQDDNLYVYMQMMQMMAKQVLAKCEIKRLHGV